MVDQSHLTRRSVVCGRSRSSLWARLRPVRLALLGGKEEVLEVSDLRKMMDSIRPGYAAGEQAPKPLLPPSRLRGYSDVAGAGRVRVSIICLTYNHRDFVVDALNGFLAQETQFPFEILVRDDASDDGTQTLLRNYEARYGGLLRLYLEERNRWKEVGGDIGRLLFEARGDLIAFCEGDDYWFDPFKLQNQFDVLERNPNVSLVTTGQVNVSQGIVTSTRNEGGTRTWLFRKRDIPISFLQETAGLFHYADGFVLSSLRSKGRTVHMRSMSAVCREHPGGIYSSIVSRDPVRYRFEHVKQGFWLMQYYHSVGDKPRETLYAFRILQYVAGSLSVSVGSLLVQMPFRFFQLLIQRVTRVFRGRSTSR